MVVPLHVEQDWLPVLTDRPEFIPGSGPTLIIAPHPDDETLATAGLIASQRSRNVPVTLIAVTDGESAYEDRDERLGIIRAQEQTRASQCLGLDSSSIIRLGITDSGVSKETDKLIAGLSPYITRDIHVVAPWPNDFHPDHEACGKVAAMLAREQGARLSFYFFWTWHRGTPALLRDLPLALLPLSDDFQRRKAEALGKHASQLQNPSGDPILHEEHLWPARLPFEVFLPS